MLDIKKTKLINYLIKERLSEIDELIKLSDECDIVELQTEQNLLNETYEELSNDLV
jgi:hypothetical protein